MGVVGNLTVKNNAVDASVKPGKALGQSMLMGIVAFGLSLLLGNGLLGSLGFGLGSRNHGTGNSHHGRQSGRYNQRQRVFS